MGWGILEVHGWRTLGVGEGDWKGFSGKEGFGPAVCFGVGGGAGEGLNGRLNPCKGEKSRLCL